MATYVIYNEINGVFLGMCFGLEFWSKLDPVGQPSAVTFESAKDAESFMATWVNGVPAGTRFVEVRADVEGTHASIASCIQAGLPGWIDELTPVANLLPV